MVPRPRPDSDECPGLKEELDEMKALNTGFLNAVAGALIVLDKQWRLYYLNEEAKQFFEGDKTSLTGMPWEEVYPRNLGKMLAPDMIEQILNSKEKTRTRYSSYLYKWYKITASSSNFGVFIRLEDVTHEMLINRLLRLNEFTVNNAQDFIFWVKKSGHIIYANNAICNRLNYEKEEITRIKIHDIDISLTANSWQEFYEKLKIEGRSTHESEFRARNRSIIPVEVNYSLIDYYGEEYIIAFARDISERKRVELALNESKNQSELYLDLMGHDINNMHQIAMGYLEIVEGMMPCDDSRREYIEKPIEVLQRSAQLIKNVRKLQKIRDGVFRTQEVDVCQFLVDVQREFGAVPHKAISLNLNGCERCHVRANELLHDVFANLVSNAIKHTGDRADINIYLNTVDDPHYCQVAVEDNGPGIPDDFKDKIFNRLLKCTDQAKGIGLGLSLVKSLVEGYGGRVWVEDRVKGDHTQGARFVVVLPSVNN